MQTYLADAGMQRALAEAHRSLNEGGIPIGAALMDDERRIVGVGHNRRVQQKSPVLHAEIDCLAAAGPRHDYAGLVMYSTLMPCYMCAGAIIQFRIRHIVVGEARNFPGAKELLCEHGVEVVDLDSPVCRDLLSVFIQAHRDLWLEDIGANF